MNPIKILLVEDDEELGQAYVTRLQAEGMEVNWTKNGEEALAETVRFKPDVLLLDIMMPRISGFDVLDILKNTPETRDTKIVVLSALSSPEDIEKARMLGANDYLVKAQVTVADVVETIRRHTGAPAVAAAPTAVGTMVEPTNPTPVSPAPVADPTMTAPIVPVADTQQPESQPSPPNDPTQPPTPGAVITPTQKTE